MDTDPSRAPTSVAPPSLPTGTRGLSVASPSLATGSRAPGPPTIFGSRPPQSVAPPLLSTVPRGSAVPLSVPSRATVVPPFTAFRGTIVPSPMPAPPSSRPRASVVPSTIIKFPPTLSSRARRGTVLSTAFLDTISESDGANAAAPDNSTEPASVIRTSRGPLRSVYTAPEDLEAATRQTMYESLKEEERILQDKWAKRQADQLAPCPADLLWVRHATHTGYRCTGGMHYVSDVMIAEGQPGVYTKRTPPKNLAREMVPGPEHNIPPGYFGPVRPEKWDSVEERWIYPRWSQGCGPRGFRDTFRWLNTLRC